MYNFTGNVGKVPSRYLPYALLHDIAQHAFLKLGQRESDTAAELRIACEGHTSAPCLRRGVLQTYDAALWRTFQAAAGREVAAFDEAVWNTTERLNIWVRYFEVASHNICSQFHRLYNRCVLEAEWPAHSTSSQLLWNKLRYVVLGAAHFRWAAKRHAARKLSASTEGGT